MLAVYELSIMGALFMLQLNKKLYGGHYDQIILRAFGAQSSQFVL